MTVLETQVSSALMRLRMIERALHDKDGWGFDCAGMTAPAAVEETEECIRFTGLLPGACTLGDEFPAVTITKDGDPVWVVSLSGHLGEYGTAVTYEVGLGGVPVGE